MDVAIDRRLVIGVTERSQSGFCILGGCEHSRGGVCCTIGQDKFEDLFKELKVACNSCAFRF